MQGSDRRRNCRRTWQCLYIDTDDERGVRAVDLPDRRRWSNPMEINETLIADECVSGRAARGDH